MFDLKDWARNTGLLVEEICLRKEAPCVGIALAFYDPLEQDVEQMWQFVTKLSFSRETPPTEEEKAQLDAALAFIMEGVKKIMGGDKAVMNIVELYSRGELH
jgi:hypothetical protein